MTDTPTDQIYSSPLQEISGFRFDQTVAAVFPNMIKRSVPGYEAIISMIGELAQRYTQPDTRLYDLGCSLGASLLSMRHRVKAAGVEFIGIDNSEAMLTQCQKIVSTDGAGAPITLRRENIEDSIIENASFVVLNFTLQFVPLQKRRNLIQKIFQGLLPGGALIVSEKICFTDPQHQQLMIELHENFKRANGYSELEIAQKRTALENVLIPETLDAHLQRFEQVGFGSSDVWFQCLNFASMIAIKS